MKRLFLNLILTAASTAAFADSYQWLEENTPERQVWVEKQRALSEAYFDKLDSREIEQELFSLTTMEQWRLPTEKNGVLYYCKRSANENRTVLVRKKGDKKEILVDPNLFEEEVILVGFTLSPNGRYLSYGLSIAGSDQHVWHILDLKHGFELPEVFTKIQFSDLIWDESSDRVYYIKNNAEVYAHDLGNSVEEDKLLYQPDEDVFVYRPLLVCENRYLLVEERRQVVKRVGIRLIDLLEQRSSELIPPGEFDVFPIGSLDDEILMITDEECPMGKLIAIDAQRNERTIINESQGLLQEVEIIGEKLVCSYLENACAALKIFDREGEYLYSISLPTMGSVDIDSSENALFYSYTDFYTPTQIYRHNMETGITVPLHAPVATRHEMVTEQVWYESQDGTLISMFLTHRKDLFLNEKPPVLLYGYGGFGLPVTPFFRSYQLKWIEDGGVFAVPNVRGGKEYGTDWYDNGKSHCKQNGFNDFIAAAEWLHKKKMGPIAIFGTSNGGLLMGASLTQRPDLFDAAVVNKGVLDMLRFHLFTIGRFWICDYGNPEDPEDYAYLLSYSPCHNVREGVDYPPILINTADRDDRVVPMHSFKFYAALKEANRNENPILLRLEEACGHGGSDSRQQEVAFGRDLLAFFYSELAFKKGTIKPATCASRE